MDFLRKPFPIEETPKGQAKTAFAVGLFVTLFLYIFKPFGVNNIESNAFLFCLQFGAVVLIAMFIYELGLRLAILSGMLKPKIYTYKLWLIKTMGLLCVIGLCNFLLLSYLGGSFYWPSLLPNLVYTFAIGIFPVAASGALAIILSEKKHQNLAQQLNQTHPLKEPNTPDQSLQLFDTPIHKIYAIESIQNYVKIYWESEDGNLQDEIHRATLKSLLEQSQGTNLKKCHRSYLVNTEKIESYTGNAQGLVLSLADNTLKIPVSRSYVGQFKPTLHPI